MTKPKEEQHCLQKKHCYKVRLKIKVNFLVHNYYETPAWTPCENNFFFFNFERQGKGESKRRRDTSICERCTNRLPLACLQLGIWPTTQACALPGNLTSNLSVCRPALNPLSHTTQRITFTIQKEAVFFYYSMRLKANLKELWFSPIKSSVDIVPLSRLLTNITHFKFPPFTHGGFSFK